MIAVFCDKEKITAEIVDLYLLQSACKGVSFFLLPHDYLREHQNENINLELLMNCLFRGILRAKMKLATTAAAAAAAVPII